MQKLITILCLVCFYSALNPASAQQNSEITSTFYDRVEDFIVSTDTIPDFKSKTHKLKLTGIVYQSDGVTPAKDVILYIEQPDEDGDFELRKAGEERYIFHRGWVKTDNDGRYTFYTFIPGNDRRYNQMQQIFPTIKEQNREEVQLQSLLFDEDPLLTKRCRKRLAKKGHSNRILKVTKQENLYVAQKDIVLPEHTEPMTK